MNNQKHEFALYLDNLSQMFEAQQIGDQLTIADAVLIHRIQTILRLQSSDTVRLFDAHRNALAELESIEKKQILAKIKEVQPNIVLSPSITILLPVLKREALNDAVYSCIELGAQTIQLVYTEKSQRICNMQHLNKVMIAAAEQSKNFAMAALHEPVSLAHALENSKAQASKIFFDQSGESAAALLKSATLQDPITILIGPEGDLTNAEKESVGKNSFIMCALTPTVLRAQQALVVGLGLMRSLIKLD